MLSFFILFFFFTDTSTTEIYTLSLHDALPILCLGRSLANSTMRDCRHQPDSQYTLSSSIAHWNGSKQYTPRSEEHTSELQSQSNLVCRLLLEKKKKKQENYYVKDYNQHETYIR